MVAQTVAGTVSVWLGDGAGGFRQAAGSPLPVGRMPRSVAVADLDDDGKADVVTANDDGTMALFLGRGGGAFQAARTLRVGEQFGTVIAAPLLRQQLLLDLVVTDRASGQVHVLVNRGHGEFEPPRAYPVGRRPLGIAAGDLDGDGAVDLAVANQLDGTLSLLPGRGDHTFGPAETLAVPAGPECVVLGDLDGDGTLDIVLTNNPVNLVTVLLNSR